MEGSIIEKMIGKKVIVRSLGAGVFFGTLREKRESQAGVEVVMENSRRIWRWEGANTLSQLAVEGTKKPEGCLFSVEVPYHAVMNVVEIIPCTPLAVGSIESVEVWRIK